MLSVPRKYYSHDDDDSDEEDKVLYAEINEKSGNKEIIVNISSYKIKFFISISKYF